MAKRNSGVKTTKVTTEWNGGPGMPKRKEEPAPLPKQPTPMPDMGTGGFTRGSGGKATKPRSFDTPLPERDGFVPTPRVPKPKAPPPNAPIGGPVEKPGFGVSKPPKQTMQPSEGAKPPRQPKPKSAGPLPKQPTPMPDMGSAGMKNTVKPKMGKITSMKRKRKMQVPSM